MADAVTSSSGICAFSVGTVQSRLPGPLFSLAGQNEVFLLFSASFGMRNHVKSLCCMPPAANYFADQNWETSHREVESSWEITQSTRISYA